MKCNICLSICLCISFITATAITHILLWYNLTCVKTSSPSSVKLSDSDLNDLRILRTKYQELKNEINQGNHPWKAKVYPKLELRAKMPVGTYEEIAISIKAWTEPKFIDGSVDYLRKLDNLDVILPESFDSRVKWPLCYTIHTIRNQGSCGSCWAESVTSVISDRLCIASNASTNAEISSQDLIECCADCRGCHGALTYLHAYNHWIQHGLVTGGRYGSNEGCKPFKFHSDCGTPCAMEEYLNNPERGRNHSCQRGCRKDYPLNYDQDKYYGSAAYFIGIAHTINTFGAWQSAFISEVPESNWTEFKEALGADLLSRKIYLFNATFATVEKRMQKELITNGPLSVCFRLPATFLLYESGVYGPINVTEDLNSIADYYMYGHCVKVIGWGVETYNWPGVRLNDQSWSTRVPYWLIANSWGRDWGERGFVKMLRNADAFPDLYHDIVVAHPLL